MDKKKRFEVEKLVKKAMKQKTEIEETESHFIIKIPQVLNLGEYKVTCPDCGGKFGAVISFETELTLDRKLKEIIEIKNTE